MKLKDYPKEIQELIVKRHKECMEKSHESIRSFETVSTAFVWEETPEGSVFWNQIDDGNLQPFYDKYPVPDTREKK